MWRRDPTYRDMVDVAWQTQDTSVSLNQLASKLGHVTKVMKEWEFSSFGQVKKDLKRLREELEVVLKSNLRAGPS